MSFHFIYINIKKIELVFHTSKKANEKKWRKLLKSETEVTASIIHS